VVRGGRSPAGVAARCTGDGTDDELGKISIIAARLD
jgi:hypothetical protein